MKIVFEAKVCTTCGKTKALLHFYRDKRGVYTPDCKMCRRLAVAKRRNP